jgi:hypothetical protein
MSSSDSSKLLVIVLVLVMFVASVEKDSPDLGVAALILVIVFVRLLSLLCNMTGGGVWYWLRCGGDVGNRRTLGFARIVPGASVALGLRELIDGSLNCAPSTEQAFLISSRLPC